LRERSRSMNKAFAEEFMKKWEEELLRLSKDTSNQIHREITQDDLRIYWDMNLTTFELREFNHSSEMKCFDLLFEHYLDQDILNDVASEEEINFSIEINANEEELRDLSVDNDDYEYFEFLSENRILSDLELESTILSKYKHPSVFGDIYDDSSTTYRGIFGFLDQHTDQIKGFLPRYEREVREFYADESAWNE
jgi:hypothetical protein